MPEGVSPSLREQTAFFRSRLVKQRPKKASARLTGYVSVGPKSTLPMTGVSLRKLTGTLIAAAILKDKKGTKAEQALFLTKPQRYIDPSSHL